MRWLIVAHEKEIPHFDTLCTDAWRTASVGVGQFASVAALSAMLEHEQPEGILLSGTAGSLDKRHLQQLYWVQHFAYASIADEELPEFLPHAFTTVPVVTDAVGFPPATIVQNHGISLNPEKFLANTRYVPAHYPAPILENMEATSLAELCYRRKIPFSALVCISNTIGTDSRREWRENFLSAGQKLLQALRSLMQSR